MKSVGLVLEFHVLISIQNSEVFVLYPGRYIWISRAFRICQNCWHSHHVLFISRVLNLRLRWFQLGWTHNFSLLDLEKSPLFMDILAGSYVWSIRRIPLTLLTTCSVVPLTMSCLVEFSVCMMMLVLVLWSECWCIVGLISAITCIPPIPPMYTTYTTWKGFSGIQLISVLEPRPM
jgi:hypothetical protein